MDAFSHYWHLWRIDPGNEQRRYERTVLPQAQDFFETRMAECETQASIPASQLQQPAVQTALLSQFRSPGERPRSRAEAGLCLRCRLSEPILRACQKLDSLFSGNKAFSYQDLLPFVLNDDGQQLIVLDAAEQTQLVLDGHEGLQLATFKVFSVDVLKTYRASSSNAPPSMSLANWAFLQTKQHKALKKFLAEFGFKPFSDWTLLNRIGLYQMERLSEGDRNLVEAFHAVYRRDRRAQKQVSRCIAPSQQHLEQMTQRQSKVRVHLSESVLLEALKQVAKQLRQFDIWKSREPLEVKDIE
ncbi:MAG: hypothetical protein WBD47_16075, partial [Phormidesmis sp.]